ncbi:unnamed protein product [Callosobruchus maculatus]|uniref:Uncharacterized protein n=1 Tax=Callosobruchus maculatus TaxID=64391 RepID=A0A653DCE6_CALMS|nr:unnamed protein product [Callosobruchus maculatus]
MIAVVVGLRQPLLGLLQQMGQTARLASLDSGSETSSVPQSFTRSLSARIPRKGPVRHRPEAQEVSLPQVLETRYFRSCKRFRLRQVLASLARTPSTKWARWSSSPAIFP